MEVQEEMWQITFNFFYFFLFFKQNKSELSTMACGVKAALANIIAEPCSRQKISLLSYTMHICYVVE